MLVTPILRAASGRPGFWTRSVEELGRQARIAMNFDGMLVPEKPFHLVRFEDDKSLSKIKLMSDKTAFGGFSEANLTFVPGSRPEAQSKPESQNLDSTQTDADASDVEPPHALFTGSISTQLPHNRPEIQRSGFAAWRTQDRGASLFGKLLWDIDPYSYLALRVKSDGRKYFVNIQTESIVPTDIHQHLLPCFSPGEWETIIIPFSAFVRTNHGMVVEPQKEMMRQKVRTIGIGLTDRVQGPFELRVAEMWATNVKPMRKDLGGSGFEVKGREEDKEDNGQGKRAKTEQGPEKVLF